MKVSSLFCLIVCSSVAHVSWCSDQNTYSFDIVNKNTWYSIAKKIFESTTPCNFTVIPSSYVNNSDEVSSGDDSVLLIRKKLKDPSEAGVEGIGEGSIKAIQKNKVNNGNELSSNSLGYGKPQAREHLGGFVGGTSTLQSLVKARKAGTFFIVYSYYRPFDPTANSNTKILKLTVS
ncbi:hypothetical protein PCYB_071970 [Plasmodium cynomolgi strain B]|uniref:Inhibitor of cysteine proteases n=1 Tax=Plasmodium cynomolgi (strain B) TaxID=1120755 RepID=K6UU59_PLACD|nr:hypothetical protein PCYB_071970 [Plasmodium cynomolgi strain B]GAB65695.1 hypothetical protein PCYB_071970 [Plasmodium cynomolgi strain B]